MAASFLVGLLLVATSLAAHWHSEGVATDSCSTCVAAHLTPLEPASPPALAPQSVAGVEPSAPVADSLLRGHSTRPRGRSPPRDSLVLVIA
ncbi:MAG: hypothetical protein WCH13_09055 [Deltaproteobacteria bacterium]